MLEVGLSMVGLKWGLLQHIVVVLVVGLMLAPHILESLMEIDDKTTYTLVSMVPVIFSDS